MISTKEDCERCCLLGYNAMGTNSHAELFYLFSFIVMIVYMIPFVFFIPLTVASLRSFKEAYLKFYNYLKPKIIMTAVLVESYLLLRIYCYQLEVFNFAFFERMKIYALTMIYIFEVFVISGIIYIQFSNLLDDLN